MKLNIVKKHFINVIKYFFLPMIVSLCISCNTVNNINTENESVDDDNGKSWGGDPFMNRASKVVPMISKTIVLPNGNEKEQEKEE
jgi:hypothetical protein